MACSRMPKCSTRPYGWPGNILLCRSVGRKLGSPSGVVLLDSARSAEPPHSSGIFGVIALITLPEAARVAMPLGSASQLGRSASQPGLSSLATSRSYSALPSGLAAAQASNRDCHSSWACCAAVAQAAGVGDDLVGHLEGLLRVEAQHLLGRGDLLVAEGGAVGLAGALQLGRGPADDRAELDEARLVGHRRGRSRWPPAGRRRPRCRSCRHWSSRSPGRASRTRRSGPRRPRTGRCWCRPRWRSGCCRRSA